MTAGILENDKMVYRYGSEKPWHSLGKEARPESEFDLEKFFEDSGLNWEVDKIPLVTLPLAQATVNFAHKNKDNDKIPEVKSDVDHYAIVRRDTRTILGVVGERYTPVSNKSALNWFKDWIETKTLGFETGGSVFNGRKIWVLAHFVDNPLEEVTVNDAVKKYLLFSNAHDGTNSLRVGISLIRCVCWNTLSLAHRSADSKLIRLRHSSKVEENLNSIKEVVDIAEQDFKATVEQYRLLTKKDINQNDVRKFVRIVMQGEKEADKPWDEVSTRTQNIIKEVEGKMDSPINPGKPSLWKLYNAVNTYLNHDAGRTVDSRLSNLWWGNSQEIDKKAFQLALQLAA